MRVAGLNHRRVRRAVGCVCGGQRHRTMNPAPLRRVPMKTKLPGNPPILLTVKNPFPSPKLPVSLPLCPASKNIEDTLKYPGRILHLCVFFFSSLKRSRMVGKIIKSSRFLEKSFKCCRKGPRVAERSSKISNPEGCLDNPEGRSKNPQKILKRSRKILFESPFWD